MTVNSYNGSQGITIQPNQIPQYYRMLILDVTLHLTTKNGPRAAPEPSGIPPFSLPNNKAGRNVMATFWWNLSEQWY